MPRLRFQRIEWERTEVLCFDVGIGQVISGQDIAKSISKSVDLEKGQISPRLHYLCTDSTILPQYCTTCVQIVQRLPQYCTTCGHLVQSRRNIALPVYTWYNLVAILHCLCTLGTISSQYCTTCGHLISSPSQYCTACAHLIQSRGNVVPLVYK